MPDHTLVITDTSCLIVLSRIGSIELLHKLYPVVVVTDTIAEEFGEQAGFRIAPAIIDEMVRCAGEN
jgi:predicted nucleic acid-binding protein